MSTRKVLALLLALAMVCSLMVSPALAAETEGEPVAISDSAAPKFTDVDGHWAESAIYRWAEEGIVQGYGDGTVHPAGNLKRGELAAILARLLGLKEKAAANTFRDVPADAWYADAVLKCAKAGIMLGDGSGKANPESSIDRQQAIVMIARALGAKPSATASLDRFEDGDKVSDWAVPYMTALTDMGILNGLPSGDGFVVAPTTDINRASVFTLLDKAIEKYVTAPSTVTATDPNKFVVVNSAAEEAGEVTVTGKTAGVVVATGTTDDVVLDNAAVGTLKVDAPVDVTVKKGSSVAELDANAAAAIDNKGTVTNLNTNADDVTFDGNKPAKVTTAEDVEPAKDSKGNEVTDKPAVSTGGGNSGGSRPTPTPVDVVKANLHDTRADAEDAAEGTYVADADLYKTYTVAATRGTEANTFNVSITAAYLMKHANAADPAQAGYWVGFGMPTAPEGKTYTYKVNGTEVPTIAQRVQTEANGKTYNTVYFSDMEEAVVTVEDEEGTLVATYNVAVDVEKAPDAEFTDAFMVTDETSYNKLPAEYTEAYPWVEADSATYGLPWLAVIYDRNVTDAMTVTAAKGGETLDEAAITANTTIKKNCYAMWELKKDLGQTDGKLSGTYWAEAFVNDVYHMSPAVHYKHEGETTYTMTVNNGIFRSERVVFEGDVIELRSAYGVYEDAGYFTGWTVEGAAIYDPENTYVTVGAGDVTVTGNYVQYGAQAATFRGDGPAGDAADFGYAAAYGEAGLAFSGDTLTVDAKTLLAYVADTDNAPAVTALTHQVNGSDYIFAGLTFAAPEGAATVQAASEVAGLATADPVDLTQESGSVHDGKYIRYYGVAKLADGQVEFLNAGSWNLALLWKDEDGKVLAVNRITVNRRTTMPATFQVTFGETAVETGFNGKLAAIPAVPAKTGYVGKWVVDGKDVTTETVFTADATAEAVYTANYAAAFETINSAIYALYAADEGGFKTGIPALADFGSVEVDTVEDGVVTLKGVLKAITTPWTGFNTAIETEQTGYYLPIMIEAPADVAATGTVVSTSKKNFTAAVLDTVGEGENAKTYFSLFVWMAAPKTEDAAAEGHQFVISIDWDGEGGKDATTYTLDLSGVTFKAAPVPTPDPEVTE